MKKRRMTILLLVTVVLLATSVLAARIKRRVQYDDYQLNIGRS